jgi:ABC-type oligopeptide transport system substrate-binding subunit
MKRRDVLAGGAAAAMSMGLARPSLAQKAQVLRYVPQAGLANPDPIWTTATVASLHGYMVWDTLYGIDEGLIPRLQMLQAADTSSDGLTWNFKLREGLFWTDGEPVRSIDCITSIKRWARRDGFGQRLLTQTVDMKVVDDKTFQIILNKPYPLLPYALGGGSTGCFIMPERISKTDPFTQITEYVGSGPYRFLDKEWVSGASAAWAKNDKYVPRSEPPSYFAGGKVANFDRVEWVTMDPSTASGALQKGEVDWWENPIFDLLPQLRKDPNLTVNVLSALGAVGVVAFNHTQPPFDNPKLLQALIPSFSQQDIIDALCDRGRDGCAVVAARSRQIQAAGGRERLQGRADRADGAVRSAAAAGDGAGGRLFLQVARPELAIYRDGLGHAGGAAGQPRAVEQGRLEQLLHHVGRAQRVQSRWQLPAARQWQGWLVRLADGCQDGIAARRLVRCAGPRRTEKDLRPDPDAGVRERADHPDRPMVQPDGLPQESDRVREVGLYAVLGREAGLMGLL